MTFPELSPVCVFVQHSYFIAPDINGLPTIPESVSIHEQIPSLPETSLPLIVFNHIHACHLFEIVASLSCFGFISRGACTFNVEVQ